MSMDLELTAQEIALLKRLTHAENDAAAVTQAAREFLRLRQLRELKAASGKVEFEENWQELEKLEPTIQDLLELAEPWTTCPATWR
jgi:hypothetical protein